jgi:hypothetical protein
MNRPLKHKPTKYLFPFLRRLRVTTQLLLPGFAVLVGFSASAQQNLLNNPGFENPISTEPTVTTNWTVMYVNCGPPDYFPADRTVYRSHSGTFGGLLRPSTDGVSHAYFTQTVSGLLPGTNYVASAWMAWDGISGQTGKYNVYLQTVGGLGSIGNPPTNVTTTATTDFNQYFVTNTADANGKIEVQLHLDRFSPSTCCDKVFGLFGLFDDVSLTQQ